MSVKVEKVFVSHPLEPGHGYWILDVKQNGDNWECGSFDTEEQADKYAEELLLELEAEEQGYDTWKEYYDATCD